MKLFASVFNFNKMFLLLQDEHRRHLFAVIIGASLLALLLAWDSLNRILEVISLRYAAKQNIQKVSNLQADFKPPTIGKEVSISQWHLFGTLNVVNPVANPYTLIGVTYNANNPREAKAIIYTKGKEEEIYGIGDKLSSDVVVWRIRDDRVILRGAGTIQMLQILWEDPSDQPATPNVAQPLQNEAEMRMRQQANSNELIPPSLPGRESTFPSRSTTQPNPTVISRDQYVPGR